MIAAATFLLLAIPQQPPEAGAQAQAKPSAELAEIRAAIRKLAEAASYTFEQRSMDEGGGFGQSPQGGGGGAPAPAPTEFVAEVQKDKPVHFRLGELEAWRQDRVLLHRSGGGAWQRFDFGGQGGWRGQGGQAQDEEARRAMRVRFTLAGATLPHDLLAALDEQIEKLSRAEEGGKIVYTGVLTEDGARSLAMPRFGRGGGGGGGGGGGPDLESAGSFSLVVNEQGVPVSVTIDTTIKGSSGDNPFERKRHLELKLSALGSTKLEVPEDVAAKLKEPPPEPVEEF